MAEFQYTQEMMEADNPTERIGADTADPGYIAAQQTNAYGPSAGGVSAETIKQLIGEIPSAGISEVEKEIVARAREKAKGRAGAERMQEDLLARQMGLTEESARQQAKTLEEKAMGEAAAQKVYAEGIAAAAEKAKPGKVPEFTPSQASVGELITMFTLINTMAFMVGGKGRSSGMAALASLNGALDGYKKGRQDIYKMEMINFDKNLKSFQQEVENQKAEFQREVAKQGASRDAILSAMKVVEAKNVGAQLGIDARTKNVAAVSKHYENIIKGINNAEQTLMKFSNDQRKYELDRIRTQAAQTQAAAAMMRAAGAGGKSKNAPPAKDVSQIVAKKALLNEYDKLIKEYTENPSAFSKGVRTLTALPLVGKGYGDFMEKIARVDPKKNPEAHRAAMFLAKLERAVTPERHSFYGAALTATELPRYERTVPTITDDPSVVLTFLKNNRQSISDALRSQITTLQNLGKDIDFNVVTQEAVNNPINFDNNSQWMPKAKQP
jgi:hypothetical protein